MASRAVCVEHSVALVVEDCFGQDGAGGIARAKKQNVVVGICRHIRLLAATCQGHNMPSIAGFSAYTFTLAAAALTS